MSDAVVYSSIQKVFDTVFMTEVTVTPELNAADVDEWDSIVNVSIMVALEKEFKIRFKSGEIQACKNVGDLATVIQKHLQK